MTLPFLFAASALFLFSILMIGLKWIRFCTIRSILCVFIVTITLFFGLKPKGYRFLNQVYWLKQRSGITFTNIGMIHSDKTLGAIGITDSMTISADIRPQRDTQFSQFLTIVDPRGEELLSVSQWKSDLIVSHHNTRDTLLTHLYLSGAVTPDTISRVTIGTGGGKVWITSSNAKKVRVKKLPDLKPRFLEHGTIVIGYSITGKQPWHGEIYRMTLSGRSTVPGLQKGQTLRLPDNSFSDSMCTQPAATFLFNEKSGRHIANRCPVKWDLHIPLFPKMYKYDWPEPLTAIFPLSQYRSKHTLLDPVINFLGFIPFGMIFFLFLKRPGTSIGKTLFSTFVIALVTSTSIELIQVLIPTRVSQILDIVLNVIGASCGALLALIGQKILSLASSNTTCNKGTGAK